MRKIKASLLLVAAIAAPFSTIVPSVSIKETYEYRESVVRIDPANAPTYAVSAALGKVSATPWGFETTGSFDADAGAASLVLSLPRGFEAVDSEDLRVVFKQGARTEVRFADTEDGGAAGNRDGRLFTFPAVFPNAEKIEYRIVSKKPLPKGTEIISTDVSSKSLRFEIAATPITSAAPGGLAVVSRAEWGADETLRYEDSPLWIAINEKIAQAGEPSEATKKYREKMARIESHIASKFPDQYAAVETVTSENGHKLVWPIEKTRRVEKVVLHHTAENNLKDLDDASLIRSTYRYHAVTRGWGDIGYNYIVGQRGKIYEGRAGGDYAV